MLIFTEAQDSVIDTGRADQKCPYLRTEACGRT
jgi:hypothetical protein